MNCMNILLTIFINGHREGTRDNTQETKITMYTVYLVNFVYFSEMLQKVFWRKTFLKPGNSCPLQDHSSQNRCEWKSKGKV